jgi:hypothetical protein
MILEGCKYKYENYVGFAKFVCEKYVSFCIKIGEDRVDDVCILVYKDDWFKMSLTNTF